MIRKHKSFPIKTALEVLLIFFAFQGLQLKLPLLLYENGGGLSALPMCAEAMLAPNLYTLILFGALTAFRCKRPHRLLSMSRAHLLAYLAPYAVFLMYWLRLVIDYLIYIMRAV